MAHILSRVGASAIPGAVHPAMQDGVQSGPKIVTHIINGSFPEWADERVAVSVVGDLLSPPYVVSGIFRETRVTVDAPLLQGHPIWAKISFFKHMYFYTCCISEMNSGTVHGTTVPEKYYVCEIE